MAIPGTVKFIQMAIHGPFKYFAFTLLVIAACASVSTAQSVGGVKGKVRTTRGDGIPGASITARQKGVDIRTTRTDPKGEFVLTGLQHGLYNLVFDAPGYSSGVLYNVEVKKNKTSDLGDRLILTPDQGTQIIVRGSVFSKEGFSISGAKVEIERIEANGSTRRLGTTLSSESGEFTYRSPSAARLRITASYKGVSATKEIDVDQPAIYRLAILIDLSTTQN